jgi:hypothetical protein
MLGFNPPEWACVATQRTGVDVPQGAIRTLDRTIRMHPLTLLRPNGGVTGNRIRALITAACELLTEGAPADELTSELIHRLDRADIRQSLASIQPLADLGVPYAMLLYECFFGATVRRSPGFRQRRPRLQGPPQGHEKADPLDP